MGLPSYCYFEYGLDPSPGQRTRLAYVGTEITPRSVYTKLVGLESAASYYYRLVGLNGEGWTYSAVRTFTARE